MDKNVYNKLIAICGEEYVKVDEPMGAHTTFRTGGPADYFVMPRKPEQIAELIAFCRTEEIPFYILGNGSNLLVGDKGYRGVIIQIYGNMNEISVAGNKVRAQAGTLLSRVARSAMEHSLEGFEFAAGIPGTIGGAVVMNAGAYGGEMKSVLVEVTVLTPDGELLRLTADQLELGYRTSVIQQRDYIVLEAVIELQPGDQDQIKAKIERFRMQRTEKQPLEFPSAGSTFKRPEGYFAGKLIMDAGLRGFEIDGAQVSEKHCGFVINRGEATAESILKLVRHVQKTVYDNSGVELELEVKLLGEF